ncbi:syntaxin-124-like protein [Tanacetum coccineum]
MNDLYSNPLKEYQDIKKEACVDGIKGGDGIDIFFEDVEKLKDDMLVVQKIYKKLQDVNEESKMLQDANKMKQLWSKMDSDFTQLLKIVKVIKGKLEALDHKSNVENRKIPDYGPDSSTDRTCTMEVSDLGKKLKIMMDDFQELRAQINDEYKETLKSRYFILTGEKATDDSIDNLLSSRNIEVFLQKAIQDQGRGQIMDTISEIQERHDAIIDIEKNLAELYWNMVVELVMTTSSTKNSVFRALRETKNWTGPNFIDRKKGQSVSSYVLRMKGYIDNLERLGHPVTLVLAVSLILIGLRKEFDGFVAELQHAYPWGRLLTMLHAMLKLHEQNSNCQNNAPVLVQAFRAGKSPQKVKSKTNRTPQRQSGDKIKEWEK